jgi:hypothetical protein
VANACELRPFVQCVYVAGDGKKFLFEAGGARSIGAGVRTLATDDAPFDDGVPAAERFLETMRSRLDAEAVHPERARKSAK